MAPAKCQFSENRGGRKLKYIRSGENYGQTKITDLAVFIWLHLFFYKHNKALFSLFLFPN